MESPKYWSREFIDAFVDRLNSDSVFQKKAASFSDTLIFQCLGTPDNRDVRASYMIDAGYVTVEVIDSTAPHAEIRSRKFEKGSALAMATAPYAIWRKLDSGELNVMGAMASPDYHIDGPTFKIMMNLGVIDALSDVAAAMEKSY